MNSNLVILDANVIIEAFRGGYWISLISKYRVYITSIVLHAEVYHFTNSQGQKVPIDLAPFIASGQIIEVAATVAEIMDLENRVNTNMLDCIHDGEKEALALLLTVTYNQFLYCTGDAAAIKALGSLGLGSNGVSLEELLNAMGQGKKLPNPSYSKRAFDGKKAQGLQEQATFLKKPKK